MFHPKFKRNARRAAAFLLFGAIINVLVAWGISVRVPVSWSMSQGTVTTPMSTNQVERIARRRIQLTPGLLRSCTGEVEHAFGRTLYEGAVIQFHQQPSPATHCNNWFRVWEDGWPLRSLRGEVWTGGQSAQENGFFGVWCPSWMDDRAFRIMGGYGFSLRPICAGFVINTMCFAATLWLLLGARFVIRHQWRLQTKRCTACGYLIGVSPVCTECGTPLPRA